MDIYFGADVGGTQIKLGALNSAGDIISKWSIDTDKGEQGNRIIPGFLTEIDNYLEAHREDNYHIIGIGIGVPGPVNDKGYVRQCPNLFWKDFSPADQCKKLLAQYKNIINPEAIQVAAANDANVAALGEYYYGAGKDYDSICLLTIGTGIGCGIVINGQLLSGFKGMAGEPGHIFIAPDLVESPCNCGNTGCVEQLSSATGIVTYMKKLLRDEPGASQSILFGKEFEARDVCDGARNGDELCLKCLETTMGVLGRTMSIISHIVDPEAFIIGGGVSKAGDIILDPMMKEYKKYVFLSDETPALITASLGNDAGIVGAASLIMR